MCMRSYILSCASTPSDILSTGYLLRDELKKELHELASALQKKDLQHANNEVSRIQELIPQETALIRSYSKFNAYQYISSIQAHAHLLPPIEQARILSACKVLKSGSISLPVQVKEASQRYDALPQV